MNIENEHICERILNNRSGNILSVKIWAPIKVCENQFSCKYSINGKNINISRYANGLDGFQALILALEIIRKYLIKYNTDNNEDYGWNNDYLNIGFNLTFPLHEEE